jgi:hypothetical protein
MSGDSLFKKIVQLFKASKRPPPDPLGDGKFDEEAGNLDLRQSIIKDLSAQKHGIPEDLDIIMEFINLAKAGGYGKFDPKQIPAAVSAPVNCADVPRSGACQNCSPPCLQAVSHKQIFSLPWRNWVGIHLVILPFLTSVINFNIDLLMEAIMFDLFIAILI